MSRPVVIDMPISAPGFDPRRRLRIDSRMALLLVAAILVVLLLLATVVNIAGAVIAQGEVSVASRVKRLSHPTGGVLAAILVRDGDRVVAGQPLLRFDTSVTAVSAEMAGKTLDQLLAMQARLTPERDGLSRVAFPVQLDPAAPQAVAAMAAEARMFELRRTEIAGQRAQLAQRIAQADQSIASYRTQIAAAREQSALIQPELDGLRSLYARKLATINRVNELERTAVALRANAASLGAQIAQGRAQIAELREQIIDLGQSARTRASTELADVTAKLSDQQLRQASARDSIDRSVLRAPQSGVVDKLAYVTVGGVVPPAQPILEIVPDRDRLIVDARVSPADIDQVRAGQHAMLRFSAFNTRTTPEIEGVVRRLSAERQSDERTGASYYRVSIEIPADAAKRLGGLALMPGMPVEAYVATGGRSMLSFLMKPLADQLARAFREE